MITGSTRLAGVIGYPARYSLSPALHNAAYVAMNQDIVYVALPVVNDIRTAVEAVRAFDMVGVSVTVPHKAAVIPYLDEISPVASKLNSVNTIVNRNGRLEGYSTDGTGFIEALSVAEFTVEASRCVVIGAGGAARAVVAALGEAEAGDIAILNRTVGKAEQTADIAARARVGGVDDIASADLVINTTPVGMGDTSNETPIDTSAISSRHLVVDIIYHPIRTALLQQAKSRGARIMNGLPMLVHQAALQIEIWTGQKPPIDTMFAALESDS
jgi:shikimate dehydrogenase